MPIMSITYIIVLVPLPPELDILRCFGGPFLQSSGLTLGPGSVSTVMLLNFSQLCLLKAGITVSADFVPCPTNSTTNG